MQSELNVLKEGLTIISWFFYQISKKGPVIHSSKTKRIDICFNVVSLIMSLGAKKASEACFLHNTYGKNDSHCGKTKDGYRACTKAYVIFYHFLCENSSQNDFSSISIYSTGCRLNWFLNSLFSLYRNMMCGKIFCDGGNEYPITGQKAVIVTLRGMCNIAGEQSEEDTLSMVPTGTKCGHNKVSM